MKSRFYLVLVVLLGMVSLSYAQFHVGVRGGIGLAGFSVTEKTGDMTADRILSYSGGLFANLGIPLAVGKLEVDAGAQLAKLGGEYVVGEGAGYRMSYAYNPFYLQVPLLAQYSFDIGPAGIYLGIGPQFNVGLFGKYERINSLGALSSTSAKDIDWDQEGQLKRFFLDLKFRGGVQLFDRLRVGMYYDLGVMNMVSNVKNFGSTQFRIDDYAMYNGAFGLELGFALF